MSMPAIRRHWTTAEVRALMDESRHWPRYELIGGELLVTPSPGVFHQVAVLELVRIIADYADREQLGVTLTSPSDIELVEGTITQPDIFVVPNAVLPDQGVAPTWRQVTALLLAVEIISPSSARTDRVEKRDFYLDAGVPEYWIVDLDARIIERWTPQRPTPHVEPARLEWLPEGAASPLVIEVPQLVDRIRGRWRKAPNERN
jgi:Uma2 family endonuclease